MAAGPMDAGFFPYGVQYHRAPTPLPNEWEPDLKEIARVGYTHVQFRPQWRCHERIRGEYTWDDLDRLFELADRNGLRVVLKPMLECAPDWVFSELDGTRVGFGGAPISPIAIGSFYVGGWLPCFDNPKVAKAAREFTQKLILRYKDHPALWFYDAWNEPRSRPLGQCQCRHSVASYRRWLENRFGPIENLNAEFGKAWTSYSMVDPPQSAWDYAEMFLWREWAADAVCGHVRMVNDAIKSADPRAFVMVHAGCCSVVQDAAADVCDDILNVQGSGTDLYGTSFPIPLHPRTPMEKAAPDLISDWLRRVDPRYWCHEFYTNEGEWCRPPDPDTLNRLVWMAISGGAHGLTFWQYRSERVGNETNGYGIREIDGSPTARSRVTDAIAGTLRRFGSKLVGTRRAPSRVALMYSRESDLISGVANMRNMFAHSEDTCGTYPYKRAIQALHALYVNRGETVDWVIPGDDLSRYELVHIAAAEMIDQSAADTLWKYVWEGGKLVVEFPFACRDANTWVSLTRPGRGLTELLGCTESSRTVVDGDVVESFMGSRIPAGGWRVELEPSTGETIATWENGAPAVVRRSFGKGMVFSLGVSPSLSYTNAPHDPAEAAMGALLDSIGLTASGDDPWIRRRVGDGYEIWFVFNTSTKARSLTLPARPTEVWQGPAVDDCELTIGPGETWVAEIPTAS